MNGTWSFALEIENITLKKKVTKGGFVEMPQKNHFGSLFMNSS